MHLYCNTCRLALDWYMVSCNLLRFQRYYCESVNLFLKTNDHPVKTRIFSCLFNAACNTRWYLQKTAINFNECRICRYSQRWLWRMPSNGMWRHMGLVGTGFSEERVASIFRVKNPRAKKNVSLSANCWRFSLLADCFCPEDGRDTLLRNIVSYKTHTAPHPGRRHSSILTKLNKSTESHVLINNPEFSYITFVLI
jgi:hypothetical protein